MPSALAQYIFQFESGTKPNPLNQRLNNPGNLGYAGQPGAIPAKVWDPVAGKYVTYAQFDSMDSGWAALDRQLALDASRGLTLAQRMSTYSTANQSAYLTFLSQKLGVAPDTPLKDILAADSQAGAPAVDETAVHGPDIGSELGAPPADGTEQGGMSTSTAIYVAAGVLAAIAAIWVATKG
jgi:hypothetical protein